MKIVRNTIIYYVLFFSTLSLTVGCKEDKHEVDLTGIEVNLDFARFDQDLLNCYTQGYKSCIDKIETQYGFFFQSYMRDIMGFRDMADMPVKDMLYQFLENEDIQTLYEDVEDKYADMNEVKEDITLMMRYFKYHFPEEKIPTIVTYVAPFQYANVFYYDTIGIGLDMYLGSDYQFYPTVDGLPAYKIRKLSKEYMVPNVAKTLISMKFPEPPSQHRFIDVIMYEGKVLYFLDAILPNVHDTLKMGYTKQQLQWCEDNKPLMWAHFIETELLYSTDMKHYIRYLNDGPFTTAPGVPPESAPMIGIWTGWQIVREYMEKHPNVTLKQLMEMNDAERLLKDSGYKPD